MFHSWRSRSPNFRTKCLEWRRVVEMCSVFFNRKLRSKRQKDSSVNSWNVPTQQFRELPKTKTTAEGRLHISCLFGTELCLAECHCDVFLEIKIFYILQILCFLFEEQILGLLPNLPHHRNSDLVNLSLTVQCSIGSLSDWNNFVIIHR